MIKIGTIGWVDSYAASTLAEVRTGLDLLWVELPDGNRIDGQWITSATVRMKDGFQTTVIEFARGFPVASAEPPVEGAYERNRVDANVEFIIGAVVVYCDREGNPLT